MVKLYLTSAPASIDAILSFEMAEAMPHAAGGRDDLQLVIVANIVGSLSSRRYFDIHQCAIELNVINIISRFY